MASNTYNNIFCIFIFLTTVSNVTGFVKETQSYGVGKVGYCNPKYFSYCNVVTGPKVVDGMERLFTNHTFTNIVPIANNFTTAGVFISQKGARYKIEHKFCDYFKQFWMLDYMKSKNMKVPCPLPVGTHYFLDLELPPRHMPVPMLPGTYKMEGEMYTTVSKERVATIFYTLHFAEDFKRKNKKG